MSWNNNNTYIIFAIIVMALVTYSTRITPFIFFKKLNTPTLIQTGKQLPVCLMAILTLYSIDSLKEFDTQYLMNGWIACVVCILVYLVMRSVLTSMIIGTVIYFILLNYMHLSN